jgi:MFS family permease
MWGISFGFLPILAAELGAADVALSLPMSLHLVLLMVGSLLSAAIVNRIGVHRLIPLATALTCVGIALAGLAPTVVLVFAAQVCLGLAHGLNFPNLMGMSIRYVSDRERTTAMGVHQSVYAIGMFTGPWLSGLLADALGIRPMMGVTAAAVLLVAAVIIRRLFRGRTGAAR